MLSRRLSAVAELIKERGVADIGSDHCQLPIYLLESGLCDSAFAVDIAKGPCERSRDAVCAAGLSDKIQVFLGDGLSPLAEIPETIVCAGMGGMLIIDILKKHPMKTARAKQLVLSPQSDVPRVRAFLPEIGFMIDEEDMVEEDGIFYNIISAVKSGARLEAPYSEAELLAGRKLIESKHPVLVRYIAGEIIGLEQLLFRLSSNGSEVPAERLGELYNKIGMYRDIISLWKS